MRNEKGITLVALILIIFVLIILAGISISLVVNNEADKIVIEPEGQQYPSTIPEKLPAENSVVDNTIISDNNISEVPNEVE